MTSFKNKYNQSRILTFFFGLIIPIVILIIWQLSYDLEYLPPSQSSSPKQIYFTFIELINGSNYLNNLLLSYYRLMVGVIFGSVLGISFGIYTSTNKFINELLNPFIQFLSGVPVVVWIPFWIMVFGIGESFKIGLISIATFFLVYGGTYQSVISIDKEYLELATLYRKKYSEILVNLYLPFSLYSILGAIRISLIIGWIVIFFVEYSIASEGKEGLGWFIANARGVGRVDDEFVGLISMGILAFFTDYIIGLCQRKSIKWKK